MKPALFFLSLLMFACASTSKKNNSGWTGRISPKQEQLEVTRYQYQSNDKFYNQEGLIRERTEGADFVVLTRYVEYDSAKDMWQVVSMTSQKDGPVELADLGFPEKNERLDYVIDSYGRVYKAGKHEPQSLFFIPSFPYPQKGAEPNKPWVYEHDWITKKGLSMKLKVTATLVDRGACYQSVESCWIVDMKGEVIPPQELLQKKFSSTFNGRVWINEKTNLVVQSWTAAKEMMQDENDRIEVNSCLSSQSLEGGFPPCPLDKPK